jgi:quercetin dioxygenase-like cupin family protein
MQAKCIKLEGNEKFTRLLAGAPETCGMKSGYVTLKPGESVGEHAADSREESIIVLEGTAEVVIAGATAFTAGAHHLIYIPPGTIHDICNSGTGPLRYVYVVTPV